MLKKIVKAVTLATDPQSGQPKIYQGAGFVLYTSYITFEDDTQGTYNHKEVTQTHFVVGKLAEYDEEDKGTWKKISKPKKQFGGSGGGYKKSLIDYKRDCVSYAMSYAKDLAVVGAITPDLIPDMMSRFLVAMHAELDKLQ